MTTPGKPPHALAAARLRMVSTETTDAGRLVRGRQVHGNGAVQRLLVTAGSITASVQGSEPSPYVVRWKVAPLTAEVERRRRGLPADHPQRSALLVPDATEVSATCSCIDAASSLGVSACKHAVAVLLSLAELVEHDAGQLATWRGVDLDAHGDVDPDDPALDHRPVVVEPVTTESSGSGSPVGSGRQPGSSPVDPLGDLLGFPPGRRLPAGRFVLTPLAAPVTDDDDLYGVVLADALEAMHNASPW